MNHIGARSCGVGCDAMTAGNVLVSVFETEATGFEVKEGPVEAKYGRVDTRAATFELDVEFRIWDGDRRMLLERDIAPAPCWQ